MKRNSYVFYASYYDAIKNLPEKQQLNLFKAICEYAFNNKFIRLTKQEKSILNLITPTLDSSIKRYEANVKNGQKGGRPKKQEQKPNENPTETQAKPNNNPDLTQEKPNPKPKQNLNYNYNYNYNENYNNNSYQNKTNKIKVETTDTTKNETNCIDKKQFYYEILKEKLNKLFNNSNIDNKIFGRISTLLEQIQKQTKFTIKGKELETSSVLESLLNLFVGEPEEIISNFEDIFHTIDTTQKVTDKFKYSVSVMHTKATTQPTNKQN